MLKKYGYIFICAILIVVLSSCTKVHEQNKLIIENSPSITVVEDGQLLSFDYQIANQSNVDSGPLYVNFVFHDKLLQEYLSLTSYSGHKQMGLEGITVKAGETYKGGENLNIIEKNIDFEKLENAVTQNNAVEIQIIDINKDEIVSTGWVRHIQFVNETK